MANFINTEKPSLIGSRFDLRAQKNENITAEQEKEFLRDGLWGFIHSEETGSAVDGPGMRVVFWTSGCDFRCLYCHNPDTWKLKYGQLVSVDIILEELKKYQSFLKLAGGGLTISGGEPLVQYKFVMNLLRGAKKMGLHTALDTNGFFGDRLTDEDMTSIDLFLLDIKSWDPATHLRVTAQPVEPVLNFARRLAELKKPVWLRYVLVPHLTDAPDNVEGVARFAASLGNIEKVEVLPFHQLGKFKWKELGMTYELDDTKSPTRDETEVAKNIFRTYGLKVA